MSDTEKGRKRNPASGRAKSKSEAPVDGNPASDADKNLTPRDKAGKEGEKKKTRHQEAVTRGAKKVAGDDLASGSGAEAGGKKVPGTRGRRSTGAKEPGEERGEDTPASVRMEGEKAKADAEAGEAGVSGGTPGATAGDAARDSEPEEEKMSEEEFRRLVEESLEKVTVAEVALTMMNQLASMGYLKMGLPESVNLKYRDFEQASLAIDLLEALIKGGEGKISEDLLRPFRGTLANLQMNFVQLRRL